MRLGKVVQIGYEDFIRETYGSEADTRFKVDELLDELIEAGWEPQTLETELQDKSISESLQVLQSFQNQPPR